MEDMFPPSNILQQFWYTFRVRISQNTEAKICSMFNFKWGDFHGLYGVEFDPRGNP